MAEVYVKLCSCVRLSGLGEDAYILLSGKESDGNIICFFLIYPILEIEILHFMVEDNYHQWEVKSNSKLHLGLNYAEFLMVFKVQDIS